MDIATINANVFLSHVIGGVVDDATARAIAALYQSPGANGKHLAALASGAGIDPDGIRANIRACINDGTMKLC